MSIGNNYGGFYPKGNFNNFNNKIVKKGGPGIDDDATPLRAQKPQTQQTQQTGFKPKLK